jgi:hypothetical protein
MLQKLGIMALAGAAGTLARYWMSGFVYDHFGRDFPWGTAMVNILGCFLFGLVWEMGEGRMLIRAETRTIMDVLQKMLSCRCKRLVVVNDDFRLLGMVDRDAVLRVIAGV